MFFFTCGLFSYNSVSSKIGKVWNESSEANLVAANLELTKVANVTSILTGEDLIYTLQYSCASTTEDCEGAYITDALPPNIEFLSIVNSSHIASSNYDPGTHSVTFTFNDPLLSGSTGQLQITARFVNGITANGEIASNSATFNATNATSVTTPPVDVTAVATARPLFQKNVSAGGAVGGNLTYGFQICNQNSNDLDTDGTLNLQNMSIVDPLPTGTSFVQARNSNTTNNYDALTNTVTCLLYTSPSPRD